MVDENSKWAVLYGNVIDGLVVYGPFDSAEDANDYGSNVLSAEAWVTTQLYSPEAQNVDPYDS